MRSLHSRVTFLKLYYLSCMSTTKDEILKAICNNYKTLYIETGMQSMQKMLQQFQVNSIPRIEPVPNNLITIEEMTFVVRDPSQDKILGLDGITIEVFKVVWDNIRVDVLNFVNRNMSRGISRAAIYLSNLFLIFEKELLLEIINQRPLSVLNTIYKLIAKTMANRLQHDLLFGIHSSETIL